MNALLRRLGFSVVRSPVLYRQSSTTVVTAAEDSELSPPVLDDDETVARRERLERSRNKSRLSAAHFNMVHGRRPYEEPRSLVHFTVKYNRKVFGKYGAASGINPSLCWPSKDDLKEVREYEKVAFPFTIQEMREEVLIKREAEKKAIREREADVAFKLSKLEQWKRELNERLNKKMADVQAAKDKKERLVDEVRRHFGFKLDPRDERFQEMLVKREKEQKKVEKQARREAKEKQMLSKLQQKNAAITGNITQTDDTSQSKTESVNGTTEKAKDEQKNTE